MDIEYSNNRYKIYKNKKKLISFGISDFPSQCGMTILHNFYFRDAFYECKGKDRKKLIKEIKTNLSKKWKGEACKLVASAVVGSTLDNLLKEMKFEKSTMRLNPNSGNRIRIWSLSI